MNEITSAQELVEAVHGQKGKQWNRWYYRGQTNARFGLVPKAGRGQYQNEDDERMLRVWFRHALPHLRILNRSLNEWEKLAVAQHHGLVTRLLDWTFNPLVAAFFACVDSDGGIDDGADGTIFAYFSSTEPIRIEEGQMPKSPFKLRGVRRVTPTPLVPRIASQGGIFTLHNPPNRDLAKAVPRGDQVRRFRIPGKAKQSLAAQLSHLGFNRLALFPDLDGAAAHVNWTFRFLPSPRGNWRVPRAR